MLHRLFKWLGGLLAALVIAMVLFLTLIIDWQGKPPCHLAMYFQFVMWLQEEATEVFPNVNGSSADSLSFMQTKLDSITSFQIAKNYRYVPGLQSDDRADLVLAYFNQPTRHTDHVSRVTIYEEKGWIILPTGLGDRFSSQRLPILGASEKCRRISTAEFKRRLRETLEYLRANNRPHWQEVVAEHAAFLEEMEKKGL